MPASQVRREVRLLDLDGRLLSDMPHRVLRYLRCDKILIDLTHHLSDDRVDYTVCLGECLIRLLLFNYS